MNVDTGEIRRFSEDELKKVFSESEITGSKPKWIPIEESQMTEKQKSTMQVSKHDSVSELGRLFAGNRAERRRIAKEERRRK